jgi:glucosamine-6-phosphate deaminase
MDHAVAPRRRLLVDNLQVEVYLTREELGAAAARAVAERMRECVTRKGSVSMVFAAAPSQNEFLATLSRLGDLAWDRVVAFHMDEYVGLPASAPQSFGSFLRERLFDLVQPGAAHFLDGQAPDPEGEGRRYAALLQAYPVDIICAGIGENGHLAFNDPHVADFRDPLMVKIVELGEASRTQQVHDGCFPDLASVPTHALTMTMPALMAAQWIYTMVPGPTKAQAVRDTLTGPIGPHCPATALREHPDAVLYIDQDSASLL